MTATMNRPPYPGQMSQHAGQMPPPPPPQMMPPNQPPPSQSPMPGQPVMRPPMMPPGGQPQQGQPQMSQGQPMRPPMSYPGGPPGVPPGSPYSQGGMPPRGYPPGHGQVRMGQPMPPGAHQMGYGPPPNRPPMGHMTHSPQMTPGMKRPMMQTPMKGIPGHAMVPPPNTLAPGAPNSSMHGPIPKKKKKIADKVLPPKIREMVPESQAYMDLLAFERKLDFTITRKRLDIQEALKKPMKQKRKLRLFVTNTFFAPKPDHMEEEPMVPQWELRVEGRLLDEKGEVTSKSKRKFSTFFKSLVIELDKEMYGPDNHLVEWHRTQNTQETDGFQVKRPGDKNVKCRIMLMLDHQPMQYKVDNRLARLLGISSGSRPVIIQAFWQYVKKNRLQDVHEREYINCDAHLEQLLNTKRFKFAELPNRLGMFFFPPDPITLEHMMIIDDPNKKMSCYDIDVEVDDPAKTCMSNFLMSVASVQEIHALEQKTLEVVDHINQLKTNREFYLGFAADPQQFIHKWLISQVRDLKVMTDKTGNPEEERMSDFFYQPWTQEAVCRYFYGKVQQKRAELEQALGIRNT